MESNNQSDKTAENNGVERVRDDNTAPKIEFEEEKQITVAEILNDALKQSDQTLNYVYNEFIKDKKDTIRNTTMFEIKSWFNGTGYPNLDQTYKLGYILPVDPAYIWQLKTEYEHKMHHANTKASLNLIDRIFVNHQLFWMSLMYVIIFVSVAGAALSASILYKAMEKSDMELLPRAVEKYSNNADVSNTTNTSTEDAVIDAEMENAINQYIQ